MIALYIFHNLIPNNNIDIYYYYTIAYRVRFWIIYIYYIISILNHLIN
jgi:hypothetical protein